MSFRKNLTNASFIIGQPLILNVLGIPATAYIIRKLGPLAFGDWAVATSLVAATAFICNFGLRTLFVRDVAQFPERAADGLAAQLGLRSLLSFVSAVLAILFAIAMGYPPVVTLCVVVTSVALLFTAAGTAFADVLQGFQHIRTLAIINMTSGLILTVLSIVAMWYGAGPVGLSVAYISGPLISLIVSTWYVRTRIFKFGISFDFHSYRELMNEARMLGAQQFMVTVRDRIEQLIVPKIVGIAGFGYFSAGLIPASRLMNVPDGFSTIYYPVISRAHSNNKESASREILQLVVITTIVCLPLTLLVVFFARAIDELLFPGSDNTCMQVMQITIWSLPLVGFAQPMAYALQAAGRHSEAARASMWATFIGASLSVILILKFGVIGAAWSWVTRTFLVGLFIYPLFARHFGKVFSSIPFGRIALSCAVMLGCLRLATVIDSPNHVVLILGGIESSLAYLALLYLLGIMSFLQGESSLSNSDGELAPQSAPHVPGTELKLLVISDVFSSQPLNGYVAAMQKVQSGREFGFKVWSLVVPSGSSKSERPDISDVSSHNPHIVSGNGHLETAQIPHKNGGSPRPQGGMARNVEQVSDENLSTGQGSAAAVAYELISRHGIEVVVSVGKTADGHIVGAIVAERFKIPWIVDFTHGEFSGRQTSNGHAEEVSDLMHHKSDSATALLFDSQLTCDHIAANNPALLSKSRVLDEDLPASGLPSEEGTDSSASNWNAGAMEQVIRDVVDTYEKKRLALPAPIA
jgi:O-antigen/teichoic acid export membrane protein